MKILFSLVKIDLNDIRNRLYMTDINSSSMYYTLHSSVIDMIKVYKIILNLHFMYTIFSRESIVYAFELIKLD